MPRLGYGEAIVTGLTNRASGPVSGRCVGEVPQRDAERMRGFGGFVPPGQHGLALTTAESMPRDCTASFRSDPSGKGTEGG
jgi:hypothetical protein